MGNTDSMCLCLGTENRKAIKMTPEEEAVIEEQYSMMLDLKKGNADLQKMLIAKNQSDLEKRESDGESTAQSQPTKFTDTDAQNKQFQQLLDQFKDFSLVKGSTEQNVDAKFIQKKQNRLSEIMGESTMDGSTIDGKNYIVFEVDPTNSKLQKMNFDMDAVKSLQGQLNKTSSINTQLDPKDAMINLIDSEITKDKLGSNFSVLVPHDQMNLDINEDVKHIKKTKKKPKLNLNKLLGGLKYNKHNISDKRVKFESEQSKDLLSETDESEFTNREGKSDAASDIFSQNEPAEKLVSNNMFALDDLMIPVHSFTNLNQIWYRYHRYVDRYEPFDDLSNITLEVNFHAYFRDLSNHESRFVQIEPDKIIDIHTMQEHDPIYNPTGVLIKRNERVDAQRRRSSNLCFKESIQKDPKKAQSQTNNHYNNRFTNVQNDQEVQVYNWLGNQWQWHKKNGNQQFPTFNQVLTGIISHDTQFIIDQYPDSSKDSQQMAWAMQTRQKSWQILFKLAGMTSKNMDTPIDVSVLQQEPYNPITQLIIYIFNMETSIRSSLINASRDYRYDLVDNLGPFSLLLQNIVAFANQNRTNQKFENFQDRDQFKLFFGTQMPIKAIEDIIYMKGQSINLMGYKIATKEQYSAIENSQKNPSEQTQAVVIEVLVKGNTNYFNMNEKEFNPYFDTEDTVLIQDGAAYKVLDYQTETQKNENQVKLYTRIILELQ